MVADISELEEYTEGLKSALICEDSPQIQQAISSVLKELNYNVFISKGIDDTFAKIRFNHYDVVILNESFAGSTPENNKVLSYFQNMAIANRRHIFVVLIGQGFKTLDNMATFSRSVNLVVNVKDISNLKSILNKSIKGNEQFYKAYTDILKEIGKI